VADASGQLGRLTVTMPPHTSLRADDRRLLEDFAIQLAQAFRNVRLESALAHQVYLLRLSTEGLAASARRLARAREAEQRRFEESLTRTVVPHLQLVRDGLLALVRSGRIDTGTTHALQELTTHARTALDSLRELTRGVFPTQLERRGLVPALDAYLASRGTGPVHSDLPSRLRLSPGTEVAAYFCVVEFLRALDGPASVDLSTDGDHLRVRVTGPSPVPPPSRVEPLEDRAAALGGSLTVDEEDGRVGMVLRLPCRSAWDEAPESAQAVGVEVGLGDIRGGAAGQGVHAEVR
jgi:signal transduction histidine kinase